MLDGQGADEQLAGYSSFFGAALADLFKKGQWIAMVKEAHSIHTKHGYSWYWICAQFGDCVLPDIVKLWLRNLMGKTSPWPG